MVSSPIPFSWRSISLRAAGVAGVDISGLDPIQKVPDIICPGMFGGQVNRGLKNKLICFSLNCLLITEEIITGGRSSKDAFLGTQTSR